MIYMRRSGYLYRLGYFRSITRRKDAEFALAMKDLIISEPMWHPNPAAYERDHFRRMKIHSISQGKYQ